MEHQQVGDLRGVRSTSHSPLDARECLSWVLHGGSLSGRFLRWLILARSALAEP